MAMRDIDVDGHRVEAGTVAIVGIYAMHRDPLSFAVCPVLLVLCERYLWRDRRVAVIRR